jgi:hypothetical protein
MNWDAIRSARVQASIGSRAGGKLKCTARFAGPVRMQHAAEALLGRRVVGAHGKDLGVVVDVGTGEWFAPKFILVGPPSLMHDEPVLRVEMRDVVPEADVLRIRGRN